MLFSKLRWASSFRAITWDGSLSTYTNYVLLVHLWASIPFHKRCTYTNKASIETKRNNIIQWTHRCMKNHQLDNLFFFLFIINLEWISDWGLEAHSHYFVPIWLSSWFSLRKLVQKQGLTLAWARIFNSSILSWCSLDLEFASLIGYDKPNDSLLKDWSIESLIIRSRKQIPALFTSTDKKNVHSLYRFGRIIHHY